MTQASINTIKVLTPNVTTDVAYEALHLFWFGIDVDLSKDKLVRNKNLEERLQTRLRKESDLPQINQSLIIINKQIDGLEKKKNNFNLNEKFENDFKKLNIIKSDINRLSSKLSCLELRQELIIESKLDLEKNIADIDISQVKKLYEKAKAFMPKIQRTFEDTLTFHNEMIQQKIRFITEELPNLEKVISEEKRSLSSFLLKEKKMSKDLNKAGAIEDLQEIIDDLNSFYERKGRFEEQRKLWANSTENLKSINEDLEMINDEIFSKDDLIQKRIEQFNVYFSDISSRLDGVHSVLSADKPDEVYKFIIDNIERNPGTGSKKVKWPLLI